MKMRLFLGMLILTAGLVSCRKDSEFTVINATGPDQNWYSTYNSSMKAVELSNEINTDFQTDNVIMGQNGNSQYVSVCNNTMSVLLPQNSITTGTGVFYHGTIIVKSKLLVSKGSCVSSLKTAENTNGQLLGSYASIYLFFTDPNNNELFIDSTHPITVFVHLENTNINNPQLYRERTNNLLSNTWSSYSDNYNTATGQGENLTITINRTGWYNCGKNLNYLQTNKIAVSLPTNYTNANTLVYAVPNISGSSVQLHPSVSDRQFQSIELPVQGNYKLVVISKQANSYFIAKQDIFISSQPTQGYQYQLVSLNPQITTLGNIKSFLNNL